MRRVLLCAGPLLAGCLAKEEEAQRPTPPPAVPSVVLALPASTRDTTATLDSLTSFIRRVDLDTTRMVAIRAPIELGAGSAGELTAWRSDSAWQRVHVTANGSGFGTSDTYWLHRGTLSAAQLEMTRPGQTAAVERVWLLGNDLYRWVDAKGRLLPPESQSTITEVSMLRARLARILEALPPISPVREKR